MQYGPRWYRRRVRLLGPLLGLTPMAILGGISYTVLALDVGDGRETGMIGLFAGGSAAPGLFVAGAPFADDTHFPIAIALSVPLWMLLGLVAAHRATRRPLASWRDFWRELGWLTLAVFVGAAGALVTATLALGQSLIV